MLRRPGLRLPRPHLPGAPLSGLQRRGITVLAGAVVVTVLGLAVLVAPVPYVVLLPGPTYDTLGEREDGEQVITIGGTDADDEDPPSTGELRLTTVSWRPAANVAEAIRAWFDNEEAVVPEELILPPGETQEEVDRRNLEQFSRSQSAAEAAAMRYLGYPVRVAVASVVDGGPSDGALQVDDYLTAVDGGEVTDLADLRALVTAKPVGSTLTVEYLRDGEPGTAEITTAPDEEDPDTPRIGVGGAAVVDHPYELDIELEDIGGPSAGLMFALGIIDKLEPDDLTGGEVIAGTGEISPDGTVGPIGGLPQKLVAARDVGATAFLVPAANCAEAVANQQPGLLLIEVETLAGAADELATLREGGAPRTCG